ncbi:MAG: DUF1704 domain-containing protein [Gammaproteobacteria bacterium]|nr:DUF1704 domain-containing protein [Gammaproteobacteria bacterium]
MNQPDWMKRERERLTSLSDELVAIGGNLQVLSQLAWPLSVKREFFAANGEKLPEVSYPELKANPILSPLDKLAEKLGDTPVDDWIGRVIEILRTTALLLEARGSEKFYEYSCILYGKPTDKLKDERTTALEMARSYLKLLAPIRNMDIGEPPETCVLATTLADTMRQATEQMFGKLAPEIVVVDDLSANALASSERVRIRRSACFSDKDVQQLIEHEIYIHVATILNGKQKDNLSLLSLAHPGATKTQEGLAVFAEFITGTLDLDRMRRLADRVIAIQMAIDGANFIDVYRYYLQQTGHQDQAFESARRVFRGGVMSGGAPFTKDTVYLDGLLRVHNFLRAAVSEGRADCIDFIFSGRMDIEDLPVLSYLRSLGLCQKPVYLPPWAKDRRSLLCYLSYSSFLNSIDMSKVSQHYRAMLSQVGVVK